MYRVLQALLQLDHERHLAPLAVAVARKCAEGACLAVVDPLVPLEAARLVVALRGHVDDARALRLLEDLLRLGQHTVTVTTQ